MHRKSNIDKVEFVGNSSNLHKWKYITFVEAAFIFFRLLEQEGIK